MARTAAPGLPPGKSRKVRLNQDLAPDLGLGTGVWALTCAVLRALYLGRGLGFGLVLGLRLSSTAARMSSFRAGSSI